MPSWAAADAWDTLAVMGPVARTVEDCAFLMSAMAGPDPRAPVSIAEAGSLFSRSLKKDFKKIRVAWSRDLGGLPVEPQVSGSCFALASSMKSLSVFAGVAAGT